MKIRKISKSLRVKNLNVIMHKTNQYVLISMYVSDVKENDIKILYRIIREIHLIDDLKTHMLIENDIVELKQIVLNVNKSKTFINNCDIITNIFYRQRDNYTRRAIYIRETLTMSPRLKCLISIIKVDVSIAKDFLFEPIAYVNITLHAHLIDVKMHKVLARNDIDRTVKILKKTRLDTLSELDYENVFFVKQSLRKPSINNTN